MSELDVPGTTRIIDQQGEAVDGGNINLVPTPSQDPEDPLNWSQSRKYLHLACVILYVFSSAQLSSCLYSVYVPFSESTGLTIDQLNAGTGYQYLFVGLGTLIFQPAALAFGKRPIYVISSAGSVGFAIWTVYISGNNAQWIANRLLLGIFGAPVFSLPEVSVADIFFYHERALPLGMYVAVLYSAALAPVLSGFIYDALGWKSVFFIFAGLQAFATIVLFVFIEETNFTREEAPVIEPSVDLNTQTLSPMDEKGEKDPSFETSQAVNEHPVHLNQRISSPWRGPKLKQFLKISPFAAGIMWRGMVQPIALFRSPLILWCGFMYGIYQIYYNCEQQSDNADSVIGALSSGVLSYEPYNFASSSVGLTFLAPLLATLPGAICGGWFTDRFTMSQALRNNGISEAEHKLKLFIIPTILTPIGLLMIGLSAHYGAHWMVFVAGEFILNVAGPLATLLVITYAFDTFHSIQPRDRTGVHSAVQDCAPYVLSVMVSAMIVTFAFNYAITPWAFEWGFLNFAISSACIATGANLTVLVILKWGKQLRRSGEAYYSRVINW